MGGSIQEQLKEFVQEVQSAYASQRRVLALHEYLEIFQENPERQLRDASRYLRDMIDFYGVTEVERPWGKENRYRVFEQEFLAPEEAAKKALVGQELVQTELYRAFENFVREGFANRVLLLHGPNGSAKSTIVACLMRGLEDYSARPEGALYRYHWVFPKKTHLRGMIGFGGERQGQASVGSYAHLDDEDLESRIVIEVRDHPLFLLPLPQRRKLLAQLEQQGIQIPRWLQQGSLCHKSQQVFQALLQSYEGNLEEVWRHVQVERYFISQRYRVGAVTLGPELSVDARERQVTADRNLGSLPLRLQGLSLYEATGELVDASGGILEFSDLLKRPLDAFKYLQITAETGELSLSSQNLQTNSVFLASGNELHLQAFREHPEFESFRGRLELIPVPYLLSFRDEQRIYERQIAEHLRIHVAPHAIALAARFAILTRLRRPQASRYDQSVREAVLQLSAWDKMLLYAGKEACRGESSPSPELWQVVRLLREEWALVTDYEASFGSSPREIRTLLLDAAQHAQFDYLSPFAVLEELDALCARTADYAFLRREGDALGYHDHVSFRKLLKQWLLDRIEDEMRQASGLIVEGSYEELLSRYVEQVSAFIKGEKVKNQTTRQDEPPDEKQMTEVERLLELRGDRRMFRENFLRRIAAWSLSHPGSSFQEADVFRESLVKLRTSVFEEKKLELAKTLRVLLEQGAPSPAERQSAQKLLQVLCERFGYQKISARDAAARLFYERYVDLLNSSQARSS